MHGRFECATLSNATPVGEHFICKSVLGDYLIEVQGKLLPINLIVFGLVGFDVILGMDWLSQHQLLGFNYDYNKDFG